MSAGLQVLNRSAVWLGCAGLALVLSPACTEKGLSLVLVDVEADMSLVNLKKVTITASQGTTDVGENSFDWAGTGTQKLSVYVSKSVTGGVTVTAAGFDAAGEKIAESATSAGSNVQPGAVSRPPAILQLVPWIPAPGTDGGTGGSSGSGGGGGTGGGGADGGGSGGGGTDGGPGGSGGGGTGGAPAGSWRGANMVEADVLFDDWTPAVAVDDSGNAVVVYRHGPAIRASRYTAAAGWATPVAVDARSGGQAYSPSVAVDRDGRWLVVWRQDEAQAFPGIWQSTSTDGIAWSAPSAISTVAGFAPVLAMNRSGAAVVAWSARSAGGPMMIAASVRTVATGTWLPQMETRPTFSNGDLDARVAMSGLGEAFVVWDDYDDRPTDYMNSIWLRRFSVASSWRPATLVETYDTGASDAPNVAANGAGQAIVTWRQAGTTNEIWASTFSAAGVLAPPAMVAQGPSILWDAAPSVTLDQAGAATIAWAMEVQGRYNVYSSRAASGQSWPAAMAMETDNQAASVNNRIVEEAKPAPIVRSDSAGNVFLVWRKRVGATRFDLWGRRFSAGMWAPATLLETNDAVAAGVSFPALGVGTNGVAATAWYYSVADTDPMTNRVWANVWR